MSPVNTVLSCIEDRFGLDRDALLRSGAAATIDRRLRDADQPADVWARSLTRSPRRILDLVCEVVVPETYFFRGPSTLDSIRDRVLPALLERVTDRRVVVWSAGCSTGEEAWTLAAIADEIGALGRVEIIGTDLCAPHIQHARRGEYRRWAMRGDAAARLGDRILGDGDRWRVADRLRPHVRFFTGNVLDRRAIDVRADLIVCRNVLIYLTRSALHVAADRFANALQPGGTLVTSPTDPALPIGALQRTRDRDGIWYQRASAPTVSLKHARPARPERTARVPGHPPRTVRTPADLRTLGGRDPSAALAAIEDELAAHPLDAALHELRGEMLLSTGHTDRAARALARATLLDDARPLAWWALGLAEMARGDRVAARVAFGHAASIAASHPGDAPVPESDGATWADLRDAIDARLRRLDAATP